MFSFWLPSSDFAKAVRKLEFDYYLKEVVLFIQLSVSGAFIYNVWTNDIHQKRRKLINTLMIIFLGVIGMWFLIVEWEKQEPLNSNQIHQS
jgi:hypothetical protein